MRGQPHLSHLMKHIFCLSQLIDSLGKWKLILGQQNVKPPKEELNISEEKVAQNGNCYFRLCENLSRREREKKKKAVCAWYNRFNFTFVDS